MLIRFGTCVIHFDAVSRAIHVRTPFADSGPEGILLASYEMESAECVKLSSQEGSEGFRLVLLFQNGVVLELGVSRSEEVGSRTARIIAGLAGCRVEIPSATAERWLEDPSSDPVEPVFAALMGEVPRVLPTRPARSVSADPPRFAEEHEGRRPEISNGAQLSRQEALVELLSLASARLPVATPDMVDP